MHRQPAGAWLIFLRGSALFLSGCVDTAPSPGARPEPPTVEAPDGSMLAPLDLVYVCGNKFLATNSTNSPTSIKGTRPTISGTATTLGYSNQRFNELSFVPTSGGLTVTTPASRNLAPPGHYMLFILNGNGVPSKARIIRIR